MLPILLVLLAARTVFGAASTVSVNQVMLNEAPRAVDNGRLVNSYMTDRSFELIDGGDCNIYILTIEQIINDMANQPDTQSQALAVGQTIAMLGELATGVSGDACAYSNVINAYVGSLGSGNTAALRSAVNGCVSKLQQAIDLIVQLSTGNLGALRFTSGSKGGCAGGGRSYQFEAAWDAILNAAGPFQIGLINEEYCAARRLYTAFNVRSNAVGAAVTAASIGPVNNVIGNALGPISNFLRAVASKGNAAAAAAVAKSALAQAAANARF